MAASSPPQTKRLKMSSTTASDDDGDEPASAPVLDGAGAGATDATDAVPSEPRRRYKRRKIAIFLAYCGAGYQGMQKNPGARTIEGDLEEALFLAGAVPDPDRGNPKRYDWARSARTDKGVSAAGQVVSGRFYIDPPGLVDRLNAALSHQIRVFGFKRSTASFNAKKFCDRRRYVYLLPVFALDPSAHPDRESVIASMGSGSELARCLECSERGRKVPGLMGRQTCVSLEEESSELEGGGFGIKGQGDIDSFNSSPSLVDRVSNIEGETEAGNGKCDDESRVSVEKFETEIASVEFQLAETTVPKAEGLAESVGEEALVEEKSLLETSVLKDEEKESGVGELVTGRTRDFQYGDKEKERFNAILKRFVGTHNFHNFTTRTKAEDPSAQRYIISFYADSVVSIDGIDFVKCEVVGQSFMLHQIRKMIGLAVAMMRNCTPESLMDTALRKDVNINVPTAPEVGLYLDECLFTSYNQKWKDSHEELSMIAYAEQAEEFKMKHIYSHIASMEHNEGAVSLWLHSLNHRNYPDFRYQESNGECVNADNAQEHKHAD